MATLELPGVGELGDALNEAAERVRRSLVSVFTRAGGGSGTIWRGDGLIVTNNHVAPGESAMVEFADGRQLSGRVERRDPDVDLAAIRVDAATIDAAEPGDSGAVRPGQIVLAAGNPGGARSVVTMGVVVSGGGATAENGVPLDEAIRADVRLAPGNSGGPLADAGGRVLGINAMIAGGMAIAVPTHVVTRFLTGDAPGEAFLGIAGRAIPLPPAVAASYRAVDGGGLLITEVIEGSPAAVAGLIPGDVLVRMDGRRAGMGAIARGLRQMRAGMPVHMELLRGGGFAEVEATPVARV